MIFGVEITYEDGGPDTELAAFIPTGEVVIHTSMWII